jgi:bla regulator protein blaR1
MADKMKFAVMATLLFLPMSIWRSAVAQNEPLAFEVASIKLANPDKFTPPNFALDFLDSFSGQNPHGRLIGQFPLEVYVKFAYKVWPSQELRETMLAHVPKWVSTDEYAINAKAEGNPTKDQMRLMMQSLLADRFKLAIHSERRETSVLALVLDKPGKTGAKLNPHSDDVPCGVSKLTGDTLVPVCGHAEVMPKPYNSLLMSGRDMTMNQIAGTLSAFSADFAHPVVDQTGLDGRFDFTLEWTRRSNNAALADPGTTIQEAIQEQLGLKLKSTKVLMDTLVIDHVERPSEN